MFPSGHFYSPVVDPEDPYVQRALSLEAQPDESVPGITLDENVMLRWFERMGAEYMNAPFSSHRLAPSLYYYDNPFFSLADALGLWTFFTHARPQRYIEVGSGFSSCAAIDANERLLAGGAKLKFIDPHPQRLLDLLPQISPYRLCIERKPLQEVPLSIFEELETNDILFLDSSHVVKTGSDVLDYLFRIFPVLRPGVLIHVHDIFFPFEYPRDWVVEEGRSWNEAYLLRAFLTNNSDFRVLFFSDWFYKCRRHLLGIHMPLCVQNRGGSLWIQRTVN
jgi:Methyltransferase domain